MLIGIDDTDSPRTMCTTYVGAYLIRSLKRESVTVTRAYLVRLNPNVAYKTRGNAAIAIEAKGDMRRIFSIACRCTELLADFEAEETHPGVVVVNQKPSPEFYYHAVRDFCTLEEAVLVLKEVNALYRGYKSGRGLIGATAAVSAEFSDMTYELLAYRVPQKWESQRFVEPSSLALSELITAPHTWDTVDKRNELVVCVPHTPDPVLFGIRGESPYWVARARAFVISEEPSLEQIFITNQGTDAHLQKGDIGRLLEGRSYTLFGSVETYPETMEGGHVQFYFAGNGSRVRCMAYEPTKDFRNVVRNLHPGDRVLVAGSYKKGSINLEKMCITSLAQSITIQPPVCMSCGKRMTSAGKEKGYKCRACSARCKNPIITERKREIQLGWHEVPPCARRHIAKPLARFSEESLKTCNC